MRDFIDPAAFDLDVGYVKGDDVDGEDEGVDRLELKETDGICWDQKNKEEVTELTRWRERRIKTFLYRLPARKGRMLQSRSYLEETAPTNMFERLQRP